ncbi:MAG: hypothetical protein AABW87_03595 [Nanoarchaeota archaeon]
MELKKLILPGFLALIMIISVFGIIIGGVNDDTEVKEFKGFKYVSSGGGSWAVKMGQSTFIFSYAPEELSTLKMPLVTFNDFNSAEKVYLSVNPEEEIGNIVNILTSGITPFIAAPVITACSKDHEKCSNAPIKNCDDATASSKVISVEGTKETRITYINNCLSINLEPDNTQKYMEGLLFNMLGLNP